MRRPEETLGGGGCASRAEMGAAQGDEGGQPSGGPPPPRGGSFAPSGEVVASLRGVLRYLTLRIKGIVQGQRVSVLIDNGATHNFINTQMVEHRGIQTESFEGFSVRVPRDLTM